MEMNEQQLNECFKWDGAHEEAGSSDSANLIVSCFHHTYTSPVSPTLPDVTTAVLHMWASYTPHRSWWKGN